MSTRHLATAIALAVPSAAGAHVSQQGFVLLLPTDVYIWAGVAVVALTVFSLFAVPHTVILRMFRARPFSRPAPDMAPTITSLLSLAVMLGLLWIGWTGPRDPLSNLMPLSFWTLGWVTLVSLAPFFGNLWEWLNPWRGLYRLIGAPAPIARLPAGLGIWPAVAVLVGFGAFLLADPAPDDPARLANFVGLYWALTMAGLILSGPAFLEKIELGHVLMGVYARLAPVRAGRGIGAPGWDLIARAPKPGEGVFAVSLLAIGSFDGLNETFWWLARIGVNPLEFPGRSAVIWPTLAGLALALLALWASLLIAIWLGRHLAQDRIPLTQAFGWFALSLLPIAFAYHVAHYLTAFLVNIQYTIAAFSDPLARGDDWLGLAPFRVTTGFFNHIDTVRLIWLTQAGLVVIGHVLSVVLSHRIALTLGNTPRQAAWVTLPLSIFMIAYTFLGLWLLAAPRGA